MKTITKYIASDGKEFANEADCTKYENFIDQVNTIMRPLGKEITDCDFQNGGGFIPHSLAVVSEAKKHLTDLANKYFGTNYGFDFIGRVMDDSNNIALYSAWSRLACVDEKGREWGQQFFATNPTRGKQVVFKRHKQGE